MTSYLRSVPTMALSRLVFKISTTYKLIVFKDVLATSGGHAAALTGGFNF